MTTIPIATAEAERCFVKLERASTGIRASMEEKRLECLMMLLIHRSGTPIDGAVDGIDAFIDRFVTTAARSLSFVIRTYTCTSVHCTVQ